LDAALEYAAVSRIANQEPRTAKPAVRATRYGRPIKFALGNLKARTQENIDWKERGAGARMWR